VGGVIPDPNTGEVLGQRGGQAPPTYQPSIITPWRSGKVNGDDTIVSSAGTNPGNCNFCHNTLDGTFSGTPADSSFGIVTVFTNEQNHHATGFGEDATKCQWCHETVPPGTPVATEIRTCENCHDRRSLHSIEFDAVGDGTQPGQEEAYFGHIGNQDNCWGCHGNNGEPLPAQNGITGATAPQLYDISTATFESGVDTVLTLGGNGLFNDSDFGTYASDVVLTDAAGVETILTPTAITSTSIDVIVPGSMSAGNYRMEARKGWAGSNPLVVSITDPIVIGSESCTGGTVTVNGSGFGDSYLDAGGSLTSVSGTVTVTETVTERVCTGKGRDRVCEDVETTVETDVTESGAVSSWSDTEIVASFTACPSADTVVVSNVFTTSGGDTGGGGSCADDYSDSDSCNADPDCEWGGTNKKGKGGSCSDVGGGNPGGSDADGDGVDDAVDNCPNDPNPGQEDADGDGIGDACDQPSGGSCSDYTDKNSCRGASCSWDNRGGTCS
jgi:hypothetical protein